MNCEVCGYEAHLVSGSNYYAHTLPEGRSYQQQKQEFPECWNNAKVIEREPMTIEMVEPTDGGVLTVQVSDPAALSPLHREIVDVIDRTQSCTSGMSHSECLEWIKNKLK